MIWVFFTLTIVSIVLAIRFGDQEQRVVLAALLFGYVGTYLAFNFIGQRDWLSLNWGIWLVDAASFAALLIVSLRTKKWWPLPIAGLHLLPLFTPLIAMAGHNLVSDALGLAQGLWAFPQILILVLVGLASKDQRRQPASFQV